MFKRSPSCRVALSLLALSALLAVSACGGGDDDAVVLTPLPTGSGLYFTDGNTGFSDANANFYKVNEISGETLLQPTNRGSDAGRCPALFALDARPDGMVLAVARYTAALYEADTRATACKLFASLPEVMTALAVRADGHLFTVSATNKLYELDAQARVLSATTLRCPATAPTCKITGIDFAPDGTLYSLALGGLWGRIDAATAMVVAIKPNVAFSDDFDIDALGKVRGLAGGEFRSFDLAGNPVGRAINVYGGTAFATGVVYR